MAHQDSLIISTLENGIQKVVLNRPAKKNAFSIQIYKELTTLLNDSAKNDKVLIFALTANGNFFSSGVDLTNALSGETSNIVDYVKEFVDTVIMYPKLLVAIVNGPAIGIACTILGLFDMVYASDKAYFRTPFTSLSLIAEGCSSYTFPKLLGNSKAGDMLYMGYKMSAFEAKQYGFISEIYNNDSFEKIWDYLNTVSKLSSESILTIKQLVKKWNRDTLLEVNAEEMKALKKQLESPDLAQRFLEFFTRKNKL